MGKKIKIITFIIFVLTLLMIPSQKAMADAAMAKDAMAAEEIKANQLISIGVDTNVYESPDENSETVGEFSSGMSVISQEEPEDGWVKVKYKDIEGYIKVATIEGQDSSELDKEFEDISNDNLLIFEKMEYEKSQKLQKRIWGIIIGGLVVALFAVGIVTALNKKRDK